MNIHQRNAMEELTEVKIISVLSMQRYLKENLPCILHRRKLLAKMPIKNNFYSKERNLFFYSFLTNTVFGC